MSKDERESARDPRVIVELVSELGSADDSPVLFARPTFYSIPVEQELAFAQRELQAAQGRLQARLQAAQGERQAAERNLATAQRNLATVERKLRAVREGARRGRRKGHETKRERLEELREAVIEHREKHPKHRRHAIAKALFGRFGRQPDHADPEDEARAIRALAKKIARLEKSLDT